MRKVTFFIDDLAFFNHEAPGVDFGDKESFKAIYTLYGEGKNIDRYELTDPDGNKISLADLNGYQKGVILNDCKAYFTGSSYHGGGTRPCGVIMIDDRNNSWRERVRVDIVNAMRVSNNFEEYKTVMENNGYSLHEGNNEQHGRYITYTAPDGKKVRDYTLGEHVSYERLLTNWETKNLDNLIGRAENHPEQPRLDDVIADANRKAGPDGVGAMFHSSPERDR